MLRTQLDVLVADALHDRRLLDHPFYRRWEAGTLERSELASYAGQYRHFERSLPVVLERVAEALPEGADRRMVEANLEDELGRPEAHTVMFERFAAAVGAPATSEPTPATAELVAYYDSRARHDPVAALAALAVYEVQAPLIAASKAEGLRAHYGVNETGTRFWDVHAEIDALHAQWALDVVAAVAGRPADIEGAVHEAAAAWWAFLDEREADAPVAATA